jgi:phosphatidylglycerophosphatase B
MAHSGYFEFYERVSEPFMRLARPLALVDKALVYAFVALFAALVVFLFATQDPRAVRIVVTCALSFVFCTVLRFALNKPRPYDEFAIHPLVRKDVHGLSFPSRHVFSAAVIAASLAYVNLPLGIAAYVLVALIAAVRVIGGVHYPRDVIAGILLGTACALMGYLVIP